MPGIIDAHSHIALDAINEASNVVTAEVWEGDALNPFDVSIYRALAGGVTISHAMHGSANAIGGQCQTIKHRWGITDQYDLIMEGALGQSSLHWEKINESTWRKKWTYATYKDGNRTSI